MKKPEFEHLTGLKKDKLKVNEGKQKDRNELAMMIIQLSNEISSTKDPKKLSFLKKDLKDAKEKLQKLKEVNESVIGDILIIADENNTYEAFTAELVNQKYLMPDELEDPETREWLETTYAQVHESISMKSLLPINEGSISDTFDLILNTINKNKKIKPAKPYFKAAKRIASKSPGLRSLKDIRDHLEQTLFCCNGPR